MTLLPSMAENNHQDGILQGIEGQFSGHQELALCMLRECIMTNARLRKLGWWTRSPDDIKKSLKEGYVPKSLSEVAIAKDEADFWSSNAPELLLALVFELCGFSWGRPQLVAYIIQKSEDPDLGLSVKDR